MSGIGKDYINGLAPAGIQGQYVVFIQEDRRGDIWLGIKGGALTRVKEIGNELQFEHYHHLYLLVIFLEVRF